MESLHPQIKRRFRRSLNRSNSFETSRQNVFRNPLLRSRSFNLEIDRMFSQNVLEVLRVKKRNQN